MRQTMIFLIGGTPQEWRNQPLKANRASRRTSRHLPTQSWLCQTLVAELSQEYEPVQADQGRRPGNVLQRRERSQHG